MAEEAFEELEPALGGAAVQLVVEVQMHLDFFLQERSKTHLWFKILRSSTLKTLNLDCCAYRDAADADTAGDGEGEEGAASGESRESSEGWRDVEDDEDEEEEEEEEEEEDAADDDAASGREGSEQRASAS
jgi:hypothetical protein